MSITSLELIQNLKAATKSPPTDLSQQDRTALIDACNELRTALETPFEAGARIAFGVHEAIALRLGVDMEFFDTAKEKDWKEVSIDDLAARKNADRLLVVRIMRLLAGMNLFHEIRQGVYQPQPLAHSFISDHPFSASLIHITYQAEVIGRLPTYFAEKGYKNPDDAYDAPFQFTWDTNLHYFDWLKTRPRQQAAFNSTMAAVSHGERGQDWFEFYPANEKLQVTERSRTLLVDIGGGLGHDLIAFQQKFPNLNGNLIVQDIPVVIDDIENLPSGIEAMKCDFFQAQPVKGAKAYYLRAVLHDWPDKQALEILENVRLAMAPDSILLINENALPETGVQLYPAKVDMSMMALFSSLERTRTQFQELLHKAGFDLVGIWTPDRKSGTLFDGTLFEAALKSKD